MPILNIILIAIGTILAIVCTFSAIACCMVAKYADETSEAYHRENTDLIEL